jgi:hypothetical protein
MIPRAQTLLGADMWALRVSRAGHSLFRCRVGSSRQGLWARSCASSRGNRARAAEYRDSWELWGRPDSPNGAVFDSALYPLLSIYSVVRPSREANHRALLRRRARQGSNPRFIAVGSPQGKIGASRDQAKAFRSGGSVWEFSAALQFLTVDLRSTADPSSLWPDALRAETTGKTYSSVLAINSVSRRNSRTLR